MTPEGGTENATTLRSGHICTGVCSTACEPVLVHERTPWGWLAWTVPADGSPPKIPHQIGVLNPTATRIQRLAPRWLTRPPARRIALGTVSGRLSAAGLPSPAWWPACLPTATACPPTSSCPRYCSLRCSPAPIGCAFNLPWNLRSAA